MPIVPPALDDRGFDDLVTDLVRRIPAHTPEWTDPRMGDPGRTLIDLFAWLGDTILYRANLIPERQRIAFLNLLGQGMRPAHPASGMVQVLFDDAAAAGAKTATVPPRQSITGPMPFETTEEMTVLPVEGRCFIKRKPNSSEAEQFRELLPDLQALYSMAALPKAYVTTPVFADGVADMAGVDPVAMPIDRTIWIALLAPAPGTTAIAATRKALSGGDTGQRAAISIGFAPIIDVPGALEPISVRRPIDHVWEICGPTPPLPASGIPAPTTYVPLDILADRTAGLTQPGTVRLLLPGGDDIGAPANDVLANMHAGVGQSPPRIDDPVLAARLITWIRMRPTMALQPGTLKPCWMGINTVRVEARKTVAQVHIGTGTGRSDQALPLGITQVDTASLQIAVEEEEGMVTWRQVPDVLAARRNERAYSVDAEAGIVRFGDAMHGAVPALGRAIHMVQARSGGGIAGNLPPGTLKVIAPPRGATGLKLVQPLATSGGVDAESLSDAERRIPAMIRHADRAVTRSDWAELARRTPGAAIGRVEVMEKFKPHQRQFDIPGVISVMIIPDAPLDGGTGFAAATPRPDRVMLENVYAWLDVKRPLATELYIIAPAYRPMGISAAVELIDPATRDDVLAAVKQAIRLHLWPLLPGGASGSGWGLGQAIDDRLIETAIARVPGVRSVAPVRLFEKSASGMQWIAVAEDNTGRGRIMLQPWELPELAMLQVDIGDVAAPQLGSGGFGSQDSGADSNGDMAVPIVPEVC